jgi:tetratricopeptide (TPR) repeat protein
MHSEEAIFHAALALPAASRPPFLAQACAGRPELRRNIEELLRAHEAAQGFLESPPAALQAKAESQDEQVGDRIGRYKLLEKIGEGGCGRVYMAEQEEPFRRRVALKIVKLGMDTREVIARFNSERQALALMEHPHIARVLDAGATACGRPFFVMELVRGVKITAFCDEHQLKLADRIALFIEVCHAVQHAHQKGIIHRDLKPSNILVTLHDGKPMPRIIDFGIAKALHGPLTDKTLFTAYAQFMGTPDYMSPEQAAMSDWDVDTRSDIYSLGVLLYELVTGQTPLARRDLLEKGLDEICRLIREVEPPRPSRRLQSLDPQTLSTTAQARQTKAAQLSTLLQGELDWIVMRCLEKERNRRYDTALNLAADLRRHLNHEPVEAGPPDRLYRFGKFVRRHRGPVALGAAALLALVVFSTVLSVLHMRLHVAERAATDEAANSREVLEFLQADLLGQAGVDGPPVWDMRVRDMLQRAEIRLDERFAGRPLLEARVRATYASTSERLGDYERMRIHLEKAVQIRAQELGPDHPDTLDAERSFARSLAYLNQLTKARELYVNVLARQTRVLGPDHPDRLATAGALAWVTLHSGQHREALGQARTVHDSCLAALGPEHAETLRAAQVLATVLYENFEHAKAEGIAEKNLADCRRALGESHRLTFNSRTTLGLIYQRQRKHAEAEALHRQAFEIKGRLLGPDHPSTLISANNIAYALQEQPGKAEEARQILASVLDAKRRVLGPEHPSTLSSVDVLALTLRKLGRLDEAAEQFHFAAAAQERQLGPVHPSTLRSLRQLATTYRLQNRLAEAESILVRLVEAGLTLGNNHMMVIAAREELGRVLLLRQRPAEALPVLIQAQRDRAATEAEPNAERIAIVKALVGEALCDVGRNAEAEPILLEAYREMDAIKPGNPELRMQRRRAATSLARLFSATGRETMADEWIKRGNPADPQQKP